MDVAQSLRAVPRAFDRIGGQVAKRRNLRASAKAGVDQHWHEVLPDELEFWNRWLATGGLDWPDDFAFRTNPTAPLQHKLRAQLATPVGGRATILDVGAGPLTVVGKTWPARELSVTPVDALADRYDWLLAKHHVEPPVRTQRCDSERLDERFEPDIFDLVHALNTLDHSNDPVLAIVQMLRVARPGGKVVLEHRMNEAERERYEGLPQWNFSLQDGTCVVWRPGARTVLADVLELAGSPEYWVDGDWLTVILEKP